MARYYGVIAEGGGTVQSAAAPVAAIAPGSIVSIFGTNLALGDPQSGSPPPSELGGVTVTVTDAAGKSFAAPLYYVSAKQINLVMPDAAAPGSATFTVNNGSAIRRSRRQSRRWRRRFSA